MSKVVESGRHRGLAWHCLGQGPLLLVMHGGLGFDHSYLRPWLDFLGESFRVVYYDHRGNGDSHEPESWDRISHQTLVDDADMLREYFGASSMSLLGHSYGGILAMEYALRHPRKVDSLILCSTYPNFAHAPVVIANAERRGTPAQVQCLLDGLAEPMPSDEAFAQSVRTILPLYFNRPSAEHLNALGGVRFRVNAFNRAFHACLPQFDVSGMLSQIEVPALVVNGDDDWIAPAEHGAHALHRGMPDSELLILAETGHFPFIEAPEQFMTALTSWLSRVSGRLRRDGAPEDYSGQGEAS